MYEIISLPFVTKVMSKTLGGIKVAAISR